MNGPEVIEYAISILKLTIHNSRNSSLNNVRESQIRELEAALYGVTAETDLQIWESSNKYKRHLAIAILDNLKPGWNKRA